MKHGLKVLLMIFIVFFCFNSSEAATSKSDFMYLYHSEWARANLKYKLYKATETVFNENSKESRFHTFAFQLGINQGNLIEKIQRDIFKRFDVHYKEILENLSQRLPENYEQIQKMTEQNFIDNIWPELDSKLAHPLRPLNWIVAGIIFFVARMFTAKLGQLNVFSKNVKTLRLALALTGIILCIIGVYKSSQNATIMRMKTRKFLTEKTQEFYTVDLPEKFIEALS